MREDAYYDGEWMQGKRWGYGEQKWPDGSVYVGNWANN